MIKIVALNEINEDKDEVAEEFEEFVSKEAQETLVVSEYYRALKFKQDGKLDSALNLFLELLEAQVVHDISEESKDNKLFSVKYNCFRNIGLIYEEKAELKQALIYLVEAIDLDDNDVYTQYKIGKLSLKLSNLTLAKIAFEKCLQRNPNHWPSKDGLLETLCLLGSVNAAYGWAIKCYNEDKKYDRAIRVLLEISEKFSYNIPFFENFWKSKFVLEDDCKIKYDPESSVFPPYKEIKMTEENYLKIIPDDMKMTDMNWINFGNVIVKLYYHLVENEYNVISWYRLEDFLKKADVNEAESEKSPDEIKPETAEGENGLTKSEPSENPEETPQEDADILKKPEPPSTPANSNETRQKVSSRRRVSDLTFLEQWGWHKNRRSARKKSQLEPADNIDTSINGFIKRVLPNYFGEPVTSKTSPFLDDDSQSNDNENDIEKQPENEEIDIENFNELTKESFNQFLDKLKNRDFDIVIPVYQWLKYVSIYWSNKIPTEICSLFKKVYEIYENFIDYCALQHLEEEDFRAHFRMAMFYFELVYDEIEDSAKSANKMEISEEFLKNKDYINFFIGFMLPFEECIELTIRLHWLNYCIQKYKNNFPDALNYLYKIEEFLEAPEHKDIVIFLKNVKYNEFIDFKTLKDLIVKMERKINLISVKKLYDSSNHKELVEILRDSIVYSTESKVNIDSLPLKIQTQIEVFLESLWSLDKIEECFLFTEKALKYSVDNFVIAPTEYRLSEWASLVNYCLVYLEAIIKQEGSEILISLSKNLTRLIQTLTQIITHQLDSPVEKNSQPHLINLTIPWIILHYLLQKEDDANSVNNKKSKSSCENSNEIEEVEGLPNALLMFFTAHEFLGRKQWCSKDNSKFLLYALDVITPILRTPLLEPFRDIVGENVEQMTYCLYGYPTKKARLRHIEEHDSEHVELNWDRAIQLFDIFRPDPLPEFDSFKLSSISSDMEQLLQRIILLIPKSMDIQPHIDPIKKFINGTDNTLPREVNLLPHKISSIYYLLADYYFKSQETQKAIKFYIYDLTIKPERFDAWAGLALSKASKLEVKLNSYGNINVKEFMEQADNCARCFEQCLNLKDTSTIWAEFGSFSYNLHSYCSRTLKQCSENLSMESFEAIEEYKVRYLKLSHKCFTTVNNSDDAGKQKGPNESNSDDNHDEKWYYHFMLGKIAEKQKEQPSVYMEHYLKSAQFLYENNATYPIKINHSNPSNLSVEALEVYYRITSAIIKYLEHSKEVNKPTAKLFNRVLKELSTSPFAYNRAKINEDNLNALKRKLEKSVNTANNVDVPEKQAKVEAKSTEASRSMNPPNIPTSEEKSVNVTEITKESENKTDIKIPEVPQKEPEKMEVTEEKPSEEKPPETKTVPPTPDAISRRESRESALTTTTTNSSTSSSDSSSSDSSSSDSDSDSTSDDETGNKENEFLNQEQIDAIYKICIKNLEECVTRFPEHYKSIYRLTHHFLNTTGNTKSVDKCKQLLLGSYKTALGNNIQGLFTEKKTNNFFNGIWRIPSQEIDRPGNFMSHLTKCVVILMDVLKKVYDHETLLDLALHLQKTPEADKKYLNDSDRKELFQQALTCCLQTFRDLIKQYTQPEKKDLELINLMVDAYKAHRKSVKHMNQNQGQFSGILIEVYKAYIKDRLTLPENASFMDLAVKMCQQEINYRKNLEKGIVGVSPALMPQVAPKPAPLPHIEVKSVSAINKSVLDSSNVSRSSPTPGTSTPSTPTNVPGESNSKHSSSARSRGRVQPKSNPSTPTISNANAMNTMLLSMYSDPALLSAMMQDTTMSTFLTEYYKLMGLQGTSASSLSSLAAGLPNLFGGSPTKQMNLDMFGLGGQLSSLLPNMNMTTSAPSATTSSPSTVSKASVKPTSSFEMKYLESLANNFMSSTLMSKPSALSITTTSATSSVSSVSTSLTNLAKAGTTVSSSHNMSASFSGSKKSTQNAPHRKSTGNISYLSGGLNLPTDLPKSLSITPAAGPSKSNFLPITSSKQAKMPEKHKSSVKKASSLVHPYKNTNAGIILENLKTNTSLSITPDASRSIPVSGQPSLQSYTEFLKNYQSQSTPGSVLVNSQARAGSSGYKKQNLIQKSQQQSVIQQNPAKSNKNLLPSYDLSKNISNFSNLSKSSPTPSNKSMASPLPSPQQRDLMLSKSPYSISGRSSTSLTPTPPLSASPLASQISPPKTLQQKLAEKQKQNQQNQQKLNKKPDNPPVSRPPKPRMEHDIIILDE